MLTKLYYRLPKNTNKSGAEHRVGAKKESLKEILSSFSFIKQ
jgi:hypothetical protein